MPRFCFVSCVDSLLTIADKTLWRTSAAMFEKAESANSLPFARNGCLFMWGAYFCMGAYKCDVVAEIEMGAYIHGCLFCVGAYSDFSNELSQVLDELNWDNLPNRHWKVLESMMCFLKQFAEYTSLTSGEISHSVAFVDLKTYQCARANTRFGFFDFTNY